MYGAPEFKNDKVCITIIDATILTNHTNDAYIYDTAALEYQEECYECCQGRAADLRRCVCMYLCMYVFMYVCMFVCMYLCVYVCIYVCMYVCMCVCMYVICCLSYVLTYVVGSMLYVMCYMSICLYVVCVVLYECCQGRAADLRR
jgi:hypothetical protein